MSETSPKERCELLALALIAAACSGVGSTSSAEVASGATTGAASSQVDCSVLPQPASPRIVVPAKELTPGISNGTKLTVTLRVKATTSLAHGEATGCE